MSDDIFNKIKALNNPQPINEGLWDKLGAILGDEGAQARESMRAGAKRMYSDLNRYIGPYQDILNRTPDKFNILLYRFLRKRYPDSLIRNALEETMITFPEITEFKRAWYQARQSTEDLNPPSHRAAPQGNPQVQNQSQENNDNDADFSFGGSSAARSPSGDDPFDFRENIEERDVLLEARMTVSKKAILALFINILLQSIESSETLPDELSGVMSNDSFNQLHNATMQIERPSTNTTRNTMNTSDAREDTSVSTSVNNSKKDAKDKHDQMNAILRLAADVSGFSFADIVSKIDDIVDYTTANDMLKRDKIGSEIASAVGYAFLKANVRR